MRALVRVYVRAPGACVCAAKPRPTLPSDRNLVVIYAARDMSAGYAVARHRSDKSKANNKEARKMMCPVE